MTSQVQSKAISKSCVRFATCCLLFVAGFFLLATTQSEASVWKKPVMIDGGQENAYRTKISFDKSGNALAVFEQKREGVFRMHANRYVSGKGWDVPAIIDAGVSDAYSGKVEFDHDGNAIAIFKEDGAIYANRYTRKEGWQKATRISGPKSATRKGDVDGQQIAFDQSGNAAVVYEQFDGLTYRIYVVRFINGQGWQSPFSVPNSNGATENSYFPYPSFDNSTNLDVIYYVEEANGLEAYVSRYNADKQEWAATNRLASGEIKVKKGDWDEEKSLVSRGVKGVYNPQFFNEVKKRIYSGNYNFKSWETPSKLDSRFRGAYRPSLLTDKNGNVTALFVRWDGEHLRGYSSVYKSTPIGEGWSAPFSVDTDQGDIEHLRGAINANGEIVVVFSQWVDKSLRIHARQFNTLSGWGEAVIVDAGDRSGFNPSVVFADNSNIVVAWCQWETKNVKSYANVFRKGRGWGKAVRLETDDGETCGVKVAAGPDGKVIAIFEQENSYPGRNMPVNRMFAVELKEPDQVLNSQPANRNREQALEETHQPIYTVKNITKGDIEKFYAEFSPDGKSIVYSFKSGVPAKDDFLRHSNTYWNLRKMDADGSNGQPLTTGDVSDTAPTFTPDGERILFASNRRKGNWDIWSINRDGSAMRRLTEGEGMEMSPRPTPDGKELVFISTEGGPHSVWIMGMDGSNPRRWTSGGTGDWFPAMNPDGTEIIFVSTRLGHGDIWTIDSKEKFYRRLTHGMAPEFSPAWSPDGTTIAYVTKSEGKFDVWVMARDGSNKRRLTNGISGGNWGSKFSATRIMETAGYYHLSWHPDGNKILISTWEPDKNGTYLSLIEFDKDMLKTLPEGVGPTPEYTLVGEKELTRGEWEDFAPCFSPDGRTMVYTSNKSGNWDIWKMGFDGQDAEKLTGNGAEEVAPVFSPDGTKIAYLSRDRDPRYSLRIMNSNGQQARRVTTHKQVLSYPAWRPDGREIAFIGKGESDPEIWTFDIESGAFNKIGDVWEIEAEKAFLAKSHSEKWDYPFKEFLYRVDYNTTGDRIVFESNRSGNVEIWTMRRDGTDLARITEGDMPHWSPDYSPNGKKIAYATAKLSEAGRHNWKNYNIWIADSQPGSEMVITGEEQTDWNPVWSPDGKKIAYVTNRSGDFDHFSIWMLYLK